MSKGNKRWRVEVFEKGELAETHFILCKKKVKAERIAIVFASDWKGCGTSDLTAEAKLIPKNEVLNMADYEPTSGVSKDSYENNI